ncbi:MULTISPECIES: hypothetical protein [Pseudofrankia]|uniref:Uncharacterized protein n=1 Tax=Pseudofrankia asymbiotica TaxID=1834516 RepID=A0A1V2I572_9ACTN|nr:MULTISPECIES: hypothetical protein [Pseudofrankia]MDT3441803.1 hypothetical protein [Pseudofrankia sp. BMG5.37]OHV47091.1 hypothetical protein BCD48_20340 [Pseudofrankia sp. BMG5.36]ONH26216.1 hypothetical protein BL253_25100 [Pseudofrankia asymbiotica]
MELVPLAATACAAANCPTVFSAADGSLVVQGYVVPAQADVPAGEARVRIPRELLLQAARELPEWS